MPHIHLTFSSLLAEVPPRFLSLQARTHFHDKKISVNKITVRIKLVKKSEHPVTEEATTLQDGF